MRGFRVTPGTGFHITFENGYTASVLFGPGNYCDHYDREIGRDEEVCGKEGSGVAEISVWGPGSKVPENCPANENDGVAGWKTPEEVLAIMNWAAAQGEETDGPPE